MVNTDIRTKHDACTVTHSLKCAGMIGAASTRTPSRPAVTVPHSKAVHMTASARSFIRQKSLASEGPSTHDREELFAREDANARTSKFLSWFAKANHPRLSLQMSRRKSRGWSAYADHDKRGSMLECDDLRAFAFSRAIKSAVFNAIWRSSRRLSLPRLFGKIQQRLPVPHLLAASVLPGKKPRRL